MQLLFVSCTYVLKRPETCSLKVKGPHESKMCLSRNQVLQTCTNLSDAGCTLIFTTHHLDEAEVLSDLIVLLQHGQLRCCGSPSYLRETYG